MIRKITKQPNGTKIRCTYFVFTIEKAGRRMRWKVIEHPYFDGLTLVRDYCGLYGPMRSGYCKEDDAHVCGSTTLSTAYQDAYNLS